MEGSDGGKVGGGVQLVAQYIRKKDLREKNPQENLPLFILLLNFVCLSHLSFFFLFFPLSHESTLAASEQRQHAFIPACAFSLQH